MKRLFFFLMILQTSLFTTSMSAQDSYLVVSCTRLLFNEDAGTQKFTIMSNVDWTISVEGGEDWLYVSPDNGVGNTDITIQVSI